MATQTAVQDNDPQATAMANAQYATANPNTFSGGSTTLTPQPTATPAPTNQATAPTPTLANGQPTGSSQTGTQIGTQIPPQPNSGLQMPTGDAANSVYDPSTGQQVSPSQKAFNDLKASGTPPPQDSSTGISSVNDATTRATPPALPDFSGIETQLSQDPGYQQLLKDQAEFNSTVNQQQSLTQTYTDLSTKLGLPALDTQLINTKAIIDGTEGDIRKEVQAASGFATDSQVMALASARNKSLIQNYNKLVDTKNNAMTTLSTMVNLASQDRANALAAVTQKLQIDEQISAYRDKMTAAAKEGYQNVVNAIGYKGLYDQLSAQGPTAVANAEKTLGLGAGGLQTLVTTQKQQQNANAIENAGINTPFVNKNGEIQASGTGYAYTSEQDFFSKTGMTIQQAEAKGMVSMMQPPLDVQAKKADVALKNAQVAQVPLDIAAKKANIAQSYASAAASSASAAKTRLETQQLLNGTPNDKTQQALEQQYRQILVKEVSSRSGTVGTEDAKVAQANHLAAMLNQYYDPKTGQYNVPKAQYGELVLGLAGMISKTGTPTDSQVDNINQATAKGDLNKAITYITGVPQNGTTQQVIRNLADSISRQAKTAEQNRQAGVNLLQGLAPTDLDPQRRSALEQNTLVSYTGIKGIDNTPQIQNFNTPLGVGATGTFSSGITWKILP